MPVRRYTDEEIQTIRTMLDAYEPVSKIAGALNRSVGSVTQRMRKLGWLKERDIIVVRMAHKYGRHILDYGVTLEEVRDGLLKEHAASKAEALRNKIEAQEKAINTLKEELASGAKRNFAMKRAYEAGASLKQIGHVVGMTKQGASSALSASRGVVKVRPWRRW